MATTLNSHFNRKTDTVTGAKTLDATDSGVVQNVTATAVITLPSTAVGIFYTIRNGGKYDGEVQVTISPAALDNIAGGNYTAVDDKDIVNTLATSRPGDEVTLFGNGTTGWHIVNQVGTWAYEA